MMRTYRKVQEKYVASSSTLAGSDRLLPLLGAAVVCLTVPLSWLNLRAKRRNVSILPEGPGRTAVPLKRPLSVLTLVSQLACLLEVIQRRSTVFTASPGVELGAEVEIIDQKWFAKAIFECILVELRKNKRHGQTVAHRATEETTPGARYMMLEQG